MKVKGTVGPCEKEVKLPAIFVNNRQEGYYYFVTSITNNEGIAFGINIQNGFNGSWDLSDIRPYEGTLSLRNEYNED